MANARSANVIVVDTTGALSEALKVVGIKYIAGSGTPSVSIKGGASASGTVVYEEDAATDKFEQVLISDSKGLYITVAGTGTKAYLYLA